MPKKFCGVGKLEIGLMMVVFMLAGCGKKGGPEEGSIEAKIDKHGDEIIASSLKGEAREWMKQPKHVFFKVDAKDMSKFVDDFYDAGAVQVVIGDVEEAGGNEYGESLLVLLPADAAARTKVFAVGSRAEAVFGNDGVSDKGQKYLLYSLD